MQNLNEPSVRQLALGTLQHRWNGKKRLKPYRCQNIRIFFMLFILLVSCSKEEVSTVPPPVTPEEPKEPRVEDSTPAITGLDPQSGTKESEVKILGTNLGGNMDKIKVYFNAKEAEILEVANTVITVKVPAKAYSGKVTIEIGDSTYEGPAFNYEISEVMVTTFAGSTAGYQDGMVTDAKFNNPQSLVRDSRGNFFVADMDNYVVRKISPQGEVSTFAGSTRGFKDGPGNIAQFNRVIGMAIDQDDNLYIADAGNFRIRKITPNAEVTTVAGSVQGFSDGPASEAMFLDPSAITFSPTGNLLVSDNRSIRKIDLNGMVTTVAGSDQKGFKNGLGLEALFEATRQIQTDNSGAIYLVEQTSEFHKGLRKISTDGMVTTVTGSLMNGYINGSWEEAQFRSLDGLAIDSEGNFYLSERGNHVIRKVHINGTVSTLAGAPVDSQAGYVDGDSELVRFEEPAFLWIEEDFTIYVADSGNHIIRKITQE